MDGFTPNQILGIIAAAASVWWYMQQQKEGTPVQPDYTHQPADVVTVKASKVPRKNAAHVARSEAIFMASRFADWEIQKCYLLSGDDPEDIIPKEMARLGNARHSLDLSSMDSDVSSIGPADTESNDGI